MAKDFFFLALRRGINGSDGAIRQLLDFIFQPLAFVLTYFPFFLVRLETVHAVPANVPHRHAGFFRILPGKFGQLLTPFLGEIRDRQAKSLAVHNRSEEHTSELQSLMRISYAVFCLNKTTAIYS